MLTVIIPIPLTLRLEHALNAAGALECGGVLMGEHVGVNEFVVREVTVQKAGTVSAFIRGVHAAVHGMNSFFTRSGHQYQRFNYLGEWHSHPLFLPEPSSTDHDSMRAIVRDKKVGANFIVLLILKLDRNSMLVGSAHTYLPDDTVNRSNLEIEREE
jgi:integrative and conjugative element protein (TIGR02256 family)